MMEFVRLGKQEEEDVEDEKEKRVTPKEIPMRKVYRNFHIAKVLAINRFNSISSHVLLPPPHMSDMDIKTNLTRHLNFLEASAAGCGINNRKVDKVITTLLGAHMRSR